MDRPEERGSPPGEPDFMAGSEDPVFHASEQAVRDEVSREVQKIYEESYGRGATNTQTLLNGAWVIVVLDQLELLPNEEFLVDNGQRDTVAHVRSQYQKAIQTPLRAAVERATGRNVIGFASTTSVEEPRFAVEIFKLV